MAIHTQESLSGFIASEPQLTETEQGRREVLRPHRQGALPPEDDGSFTQTETTFHHLVMFGRSAEHAHANFAKGDNFVAEGYTRRSATSATARRSRARSSSPRRSATTPPAPATRWTAPRATRAGRDAAAYEPPQRAATAAHGPGLHVSSGATNAEP
jgi:single-strand DNA-binding protein